MYFWLCGLHHCAYFSVVVASRGYSLVVALRLLIKVASVIVEYGLLGTLASVVAVPQL